MPQKKYKVTPTKSEEKQLHAIINKGKHGAQKRKRAQALLLTDEGILTAGRAGMHRRGIEDLRQRFVEEGFQTALEGKPRDTGPAASPGKTRRGLSPWYAGRRRRAAPDGP